MFEPRFKRRALRGRPLGVMGLLRRLGWLVSLALAGVWIGLGYVPSLDSNWVWLARAGLFFVGAALMWFAYDPSEDSQA